MESREFKSFFKTVGGNEGNKITGFKEMTVCEDEDEAYEYWQKNFNHNPNDCCNLRI